MGQRGQRGSEGIRQRLAQNARSARNALGWTQEEAAEHLECSVQTLQRIERASSNPTLAFLERVANTYQIDPQRLLAPIGHWTSPLTGRPRARPSTQEKHLTTSAFVRPLREAPKGTQ